MRTGPQKYPGASTAYWYQDDYPGSAMETNVILWHSTEGTSLPSYGGGGSAPNLTAVPDFAAKKLRWYQHFDFDVSARALVNTAGGVETNTLNVCQVEIVGTCDPATHKKWGSTPHLYTPDLPDWAIRDLGAFARWANEQHGVPLTSGLAFKPYPGSYGASNGVRMSNAAWLKFSGHCGHQHAPENLHGDPGAFPMTAILTAAKGTPQEDDMPTAKEIADEVAKTLPAAVWAHRLISPTAPEGTDPARPAGTFLRWGDKHQAALLAELGALRGAVAALAAAGGLDAAEVQAAAEAGARTVLSEFGDALTKEF